MNADSHPLWDKLRLFAFDRPDALLPFSQRLARDNRLTQAYAWRAMEEYRRFLFLAAVCEYSVTPSEPVDAVWHLHLCYTESYWTELCEKTLGRPLHHRPTTGGSAEDSRHAEQYAQTLNSYENWFGSEPPRDLWPRPKKPTPAPQNLRLNQETGVGLGVLALALLGAVFPPDWWRFPGPDFLTFYGWATVIGVILMLSLNGGSSCRWLPWWRWEWFSSARGFSARSPSGFCSAGCS